MTEKIAIGQAGGPTAVMNESLFGFLEEALHDHEVYGVINGLQGLDEERFVAFEDPATHYRRIATMPGAWLGAGRWPSREEDFERYVGNLKRKDVRGLALIGGNGTMWACRGLERAAGRMGYALSVVGIPKTVDNDLAGTDHAPGFASAARFVATMVRDIGKDLESMRNFESVRVLETMGRNVGWLALSAGYLKERPEDPPHLIYIPERPFDPDEFIDSVRETHRAYGYAVAVVSEGLVPTTTETGLASPVLGGVSRELAHRVREETGLPARGELLGMGQRSYSLSVSDRDRREARILGARAAETLRAGRSGVMLALHRTGKPHYEVEIEEVPLDQVAGIERPLPEEWICTLDKMPEEFRVWLEPLVGEDLAAYPPNATTALERGDLRSDSQQ